MAEEGETALLLPPVAGLLLPSLFALFVQNYTLHQETAKKADQAAGLAAAAAAAVQNLPARTAAAVSAANHQ